MSILVVVLLAVAAAYIVYTVLVVLRLRSVARFLARELGPRGFTVESNLSMLDLEDPFCLSVVLHKGERDFRFSLFRALTTLVPSWQFVRVEIKPLLLLDETRGKLHLHFEAKDDVVTGIGSIYLREGKAHLVSLDVEDIDARYRVIEEKADTNSPEALALVRSVFTHPDVRAQLVDYGTMLAFEYGSLTVCPARRGESFVDGIERVARLADALDAAVKGGAVYR